jgi:hypothetical protein
VTLTNLEKRMLIYVVDLFDGGGAESPEAPLESATGDFSFRELTGRSGETSGRS